MTKNEIVSEIEIQTGRDKEVIKQIVDAVFSNIKVALSKGDKVSIDRFGVFDIRNVAERKFRTPQGEIVTSPAHRKVKFLAGKSLSNLVR